MGEDIRFPIGALFFILGAILTVYGIITNGSAIYANSLGSNINIWTGLGMLVFGSWFLFMAFSKKKVKKEN